MADKNATAYKRERFYVFCHRGNGNGEFMYIGPHYEWVASFDDALFTCSQDEAVKWALWASPMPYTVVGKIYLEVNPGPMIVVKNPQNFVENT
jgi:hypothetical protein